MHIGTIEFCILTYATKIFDFTSLYSNLILAFVVIICFFDVGIVATYSVTISAILFCNLIAVCFIIKDQFYFVTIHIF